MSLATPNPVTSVQGRLTRVLMENTVQGGKNAQDHLDLLDEVNTALSQDLASITQHTTDITSAQETIATLAAAVAALQKKVGI